MSSSMAPYHKGVLARTCLVTAIKKAKFNEPLTAMLLLSKDKKSVRNDDIFAYSVETFADSVRTALDHCIRGETSRKTKDMLSNFSKTTSAIIANREKFAKTTFEAHRQWHLAADRYGAFAVKPHQTIRIDVFFFHGCIPEGHRPENLPRNRSQKVKVWGTPYRNAHDEQGEEKTLKNVDTFAHSAETFAASIQATVRQCMRGEESRKTKDLLSNFSKIVSNIVADKEKFAAFKANFNAHRQRHSLVTATAHLHTADEEHDEQITSATAGRKRVIDMTDNLNFEELIEQHVVIVKRKRGAGHAKAYEEAEERMLEHLRMALAERDAMAAMEDEPVEDEVAKEAPEVVDAVMAKLRAKVEAMVRESVADQIRRERASEQEATDVMVKDILERFS
ncbi:hypothetical protein HDU88_008942 [Geranomyces variabilis]|nr:hypothetical protein HDU88_008942 [Geranomyces variabilis]